MTLTYRPGESFAHRLDPRSKLAFQVAFALAAFAHTTPTGLALSTGVVAAALAAARLSPLTAVREVRYALPFLVAGPALSALTWGAPWVDPAAGVPALLASYRVVLVLLVGVTYVYTTPVRESRAALQWAIPGRPGQFLGMGAAFVFRFLPLLQADLAAIRRAMAARLGTERATTDRMRLVGVGGLARAFDRADRFELALRARCFAWNPTLPPIRIVARDLPVLVVAAVLAGSTLV